MKEGNEVKGHDYILAQKFYFRKGNKSLGLSQSWWVTFTPPPVGVKKPKKRHFTPTDGEQLKTNQKWDRHKSLP